MQNRVTYKFLPTLSGTIRPWRSALLAGILSILLANCAGSSKDDQQNLGALLLGALGGCSIGGVTFQASSSVTCASGTASGTGTLTAVGNSQTKLSVQLTFRLGQSGQLDLVGGSNLSAGGGAVNPGVGIRIGTTAAAAFVGTGVDTATPLLAGGVDATKTFCLELHLDETYAHIIGKAANCPTGTELASAQQLEKDGGTSLGGPSPGANRGWGFILSNATLIGLTVNDNHRFTE